MTAELTLLAAFTMGLLGSTHCVAMCGGISATLGMGSRGGSKLLLALCYNLGRIASYATAGALAGALGYYLGSGLDLIGLGISLRLAMGVLLIAVGLQLAFDWNGLRRLEAVGALLWRYIAPFAQRLMPVQKPSQAVALGALWGWLPCGLVYTALLAASTSATPMHGALIMLAFGAGTLPAMVTVGAAGAKLAQWSRRPALRRGAGAAIILLGAWTFAVPLLPHG